jgi:hypothetical protein
MTVDTLEYAKKLEAAGITRQAAEAHAEALKSAVDAGLATAAELEALGHRVGEKMATLEGKVNLLTWMCGFNIVLSLAILGKLLKAV